MGLFGPYFLKHTYNFVKVSYSLSHKWAWQKLFLKTKREKYIFKSLTLQFLKSAKWKLWGRMDWLTSIEFSPTAAFLVVERNLTFKKYLKLSRVAEVVFFPFFYNSRKYFVVVILLKSCIKSLFHEIKPSTQIIFKISLRTSSLVFTNGPDWSIFTSAEKSNRKHMTASST